MFCIMQHAPPALLLAAKNCGVDAARLILKFGAKIDTTDCVSHADSRHIELLLKCFPIDEIKYNLYRMATLLSIWL